MLSKWKCKIDVVEIAFWAVDNRKFEDFKNVTIMKDNNPEKHYFCSTCKASIKKNKVPTIALKNGFYFPSKVACIDQLTRLEERLVSPRHVFQSIWSHNGVRGQYKTKGGIVNVPVNVDTSVSCLPRNFDSTGIIHISLARKLIFTKDYIKGNVSPVKVWDAALYLQSTPLYLEYDVQISNQDEWNATNITSNVSDETNENDAESNNDNVNEAETNNEEPEIEDEPLNAGTTESILTSDNDFTIRLAPGEGRTPISVLTDKDSDFLSFPKVYYGHKLEGSASVSYSSLAKSVVRRFDRRAALRPDLLLYMDRKCLLTKMSSNISTILRKRNSNGTDGTPLTAKDMSNEDYITNLLNKDQAFKTFSGIRSSSEYWKNQKKNSLAMIRQLGVPTLFVTVSAAETKWNELLCILKKVIDDDVMTEEEAEQLTYDEKARLLQSDPITTARYFDHRFRELKKTWMDKEGPFAGYIINEYFFRVEFQHRGKFNITMLF